MNGIIAAGFSRARTVMMVMVGTETAVKETVVKVIVVKVMVFKEVVVKVMVVKVMVVKVSLHGRDLIFHKTGKLVSPSAIIN